MPWKFGNQCLHPLRYCHRKNNCLCLLVLGRASYICRRKEEFDKSWTPVTALVVELTLEDFQSLASLEFLNSESKARRTATPRITCSQWRSFSRVGGHGPLFLKISLKIYLCLNFKYYSKFNCDWCSWALNNLRQAPSLSYTQKASKILLFRKRNIKIMQ
jgi:hypothetical protein